jgi:hypothetical protein
MYLINQLLTYYEIVRQSVQKEIGTVFGYVLEEERGLMVCAELMVRMRAEHIASMFIPTSSVGNLCIFPSTKYRYGFSIENKLESIYEENHFLLCLQFEDKLDTGNFLVLRINEDASEVNVFSIYKNRSTPFHVTDTLLEYDPFISEQIKRLWALSVSELRIMADLQNRKGRASGFAPLE